jgi:hypothetical protein
MSYIENLENGDIAPASHVPGDDRHALVRDRLNIEACPIKEEKTHVQTDGWYDCLDLAWLESVEEGCFAWFHSVRVNNAKLPAASRPIVKMRTGRGAKRLDARMPIVDAVGV